MCQQGRSGVHSKAQSNRRRDEALTVQFSPVILSNLAPVLTRCLAAHLARCSGLEPGLAQIERPAAQQEDVQGRHSVALWPRSAMASLDWRSAAWLARYGRNNARLARRVSSDATAMRLVCAIVVLKVAAWPIKARLVGGSFRQARLPRT